MFLSKKLNMGAGTPAPTIDSQFNNVTMLLHGDGTNGAQNNTFIDSSTNNFTITRNGNTTQGSFSPYGPVGNWSTFFDGTQDNLYTASTTALNVGSGNFTFECFFNVSVFNGGNILRGANQYSACALLLSGTGVIYYISSTGSNWDIASGQTAISSGLSAGVWYHLALVRNGNVVTPYVNGVAGTTTTTSASFSANNGFNIGAEQNGVAGGSFNGYISNVRVVVGTAVYTSNFTPPTVPLTTISGTQLLACQNSQFKDNSSNNFSFTTAGTPSVQRFNPFGTATAYSTSVIGGSGYFDGSGGYLDTPSSSQFAFGTGDFTFEFWINTTDSTFNIMNPVSASGSGYWGLLFQSPNLRWNDAYNVTNLFVVNALAILDGAWHHVAICRASGSTKVYFDGVSQTTQSDTTNYSGVANWRIGSGNVGTFIGSLSDLRIVKGTAVYTSNFTPPTSPLSNISSTSLLLNYTNGAIFDNAMMNDLETVGNAQISTSVKKFGTGSMYFDGTGDYLSTPSAPTNQMGNGPFTIEAWIYPTTISGTHTIVGKYVGGSIANSEYWLFITSTGRLAFAVDGSGVEDYIQSEVGTIVVNTWTYVAAIKTSSAIAIYINGTQAATVASAFTLSTNATPLNIGSYNNGSGTYFGYIDDLRITKGIARYSGSSFTVPTAAFPNTGPY